MNWIFALLFGIALAIAGSIYMMPAQQEPIKLEEQYWGPGKQPEKLDESIRPLKIKFTDEMIQDLKQRLKNTRKMQPSLEGTGWTYGFSGDYVPTVVNFWLNEYDFKKQEAYINQYPQFLTNIQGLDIHYALIKPKLPKDRELQVLPLMLVHGWPGSILEFYKIASLLTTPRLDVDYVFELIIPSLPGFGYSSVTSKPGLGPVDMAQILKNLMVRLGYDKYYMQGGDWGSVTTAFLAIMYPDHVLGIHSNMCLVTNPWAIFKTIIYNVIPGLMSDKELEMTSPLSYQVKTLIEESGYYHLQATKPDTIGISTTDSPAGFAAYVLEKFSTATAKKNTLKNDGNLLEKFTMTELIDNLMMYWVPNKITSGLRIYAESSSLRGLKKRMEYVPITVPSACAQFPHEIVFQPDDVIRDRYVNIVQITKMKKGGHFAALEEPEALAEDIWTSVKKMSDMRETLRLKKNCY